MPSSPPQTPIRAASKLKAEDYVVPPSLKTIRKMNAKDWAALRAAVRGTQRSGASRRLDYSIA